MRMLNNYWEELDMLENITEFHEKELENYNLPEFVKKLHCPYCKEKLSLSSIREIGMKFHSRNIGDVIVQFCCCKCRKLNTLYFRKQASKIEEFIKVLSNEKQVDTEPVIEEDMYKMNYNNLVESMFIKEFGKE